MTGEAALVFIVILNWNKAQQSAACIVALQSQTHRNFRIIVVDNGSIEGSLAPLRDLGHPFTLLCSENNRGFTGGVNLGIRQAMTDGAEYVWLLNNDAEPAPNALEAMLSVVALDQRIGLASPLIRNADAADEIEFCGGLWDGTAFHVTDNLATYQTWSEMGPERIWLVGTALLLRRRVIETIGLFDETFFAYWEDNDYSVRSMRAGFRNVLVPDAVVRHWSGRPKTDPVTKPAHYYYYMSRNEILFIRKQYNPRQMMKPLLWAMQRQFKKIDRLRSYPAAVDAVLGGLWDGLRRRGGPYDPARQLSRLARHLLLAAARIMGHR